MQYSHIGALRLAWCSRLAGAPAVQRLPWVLPSLLAQRLSNPYPLAFRLSIRWGINCSTLIPSGHRLCNF